MIDLYSLIQLTVMQITTGINIRFCRNTVVKRNINPFCTPKEAIMLDTVYPIQNPLNRTIPNMIGIPITVDPINHMVKINIKLSQNLHNTPLTR